MPNENDDKLVTLADLSEAYTALYNRDVMTSEDKTKLDNIEPGAQVNSVISVNNRTGAVSITPASIGALATDGSNTMTNSLVIQSGDNGLSSKLYFSNGTMDTCYVQGYHSNHAITFVEYTPNANGIYENYSLPAPTTTTESKPYIVLTNKSPVTVPQGGTGATAAGWTALNNLGLKYVRANLSFSNGQATYTFEKNTHIISYYPVASTHVIRMYLNTYTTYIFINSTSSSYSGTVTVDIFYIEL